MIKIEDILENLNGFGKYQKLRYILLCLSGLLPPIASYIHSFIAATPKYSCNNNNNNDNLNASLLKYINLTDSYDQKCYYKQSIFLNKTSYENVYCTSWYYDKTYYKRTLTEDYNLVCNKAIWRSVLQAFYYTGMLVGSILLGIIGRNFGQKPTLIFSLILTIIGSLTLNLGPQSIFVYELNYTLLLIGRFLIGIGSHGISINSYLLTMEFIGRNKKKYCALIFEFIFSIGQLVLVLSAYFLREWRLLTYLILVPCLPFFLFICLSNESIQYLTRKKEHDKLEKVLKCIAKSNGTQLDESTWKSFLLKEKLDRKRSVLSTTTTPHKFFIFIISVNWIINNFVFHGLGLRSNDLGISPYGSFALSALVELICSICMFRLLQFKFRRKPYFLLMILAGFCCTTVYFSNKLILTISSALIAKFCVSSTYAIVRLYSSEYFPEINRKNYLSKFSIMARIGSVIAPFIIALGDYYFKQLPFLIFGASCFLSAFSTLLLPKIEKEKLNPVEKVDNNQQLIQNNWLDGQDILLEKTQNLNSLDDDIEMNDIN